MSVFVRAQSNGWRVGSSIGNPWAEAKSVNDSVEELYRTSRERLDCGGFGAALFKRYDA
jgi:hypothetical protein